MVFYGIYGNVCFSIVYGVRVCVFSLCMEVCVFHCVWCFFFIVYMVCVLPLCLAVCGFLLLSILHQKATKTN